MLVAASLPGIETGGIVAALIFFRTLSYGVRRLVKAPQDFWTFIYSISSLTYLLVGIMSTSLQ
ncbi:ATP-binding cassette transporter [Penicillium sp. IBT 31633x]|nr:ATP-binding cassette transporter [Penicillium sp. IBT 31633x]